MKYWLRNNWVRIVVAGLIIWLVIFFAFREQIMNTRFAKGKMEVLHGIKDMDKERIKNGLDSMKLK